MKKSRQVKCASCGKDFTSRLKDNGKSKHWTKCCSRECAGKLAYRGGPAASRRRRRYGIEPDEYNAKLKEQGGKCALCRQEVDYQLYVDHHHGTGEVRSLLCARCNNAVGFFESASWDDVLLYWGYTHFHDEGRALAIAWQEAPFAKNHPLDSYSGGIYRFDIESQEFRLIDMERAEPKSGSTPDPGPYRGAVATDPLHAQSYIAPSESSSGVQQVGAPTDTFKHKPCQRCQTQGYESAGHDPALD